LDTREIVEGIVVGGNAIFRAKIMGAELMGAKTEDKVFGANKLDC
jgi:hypothetical protein